MQVFSFAESDELSVPGLICKLCYQFHRFHLSLHQQSRKQHFRVQLLTILTGLGDGLTSFGLQIHGIQNAKVNGTKLFGSHGLVLLESLPDSITMGREELGTLTLFSVISTYRRSQNSRMQCSWRGAKYVDMAHSDLEEVQLPEKTNEDPLVPG